MKNNVDFNVYGTTILNGDEQLVEQVLCEQNEKNDTVPSKVEDNTDWHLNPEGLLFTIEVDNERIREIAEQSRKKRMKKFYKERIKELSKPFEIKKDVYTNIFKYPGIYKNAITNPYQTVLFVLSQYYLDKFYFLGIHGLSIDEKEDRMIVKIILEHPGFFVCASGIDCDTIKAKLEYLFDKKVEFDLVECKKFIRFENIEVL